MRGAAEVGATNSGRENKTKQTVVGKTTGKLKKLKTEEKVSEKEAH